MYHTNATISVPVYLNHITRRRAVVSQSVPQHSEPVYHNHVTRCRAVVSQSVPHQCHNQCTSVPQPHHKVKSSGVTKMNHNIVYQCTSTTSQFVEQGYHKIVPQHSVPVYHNHVTRARNNVTPSPRVQARGHHDTGWSTTWKRRWNGYVLPGFPLKQCLLYKATAYAGRIV